MKKIVLVLAVFAALGLAIGCGGGDNDCDKAADVIMGAIDGYCGDKADICLYCECWNGGQMVNSTGDGCEDIPDGGGEEAACEGEALEAAQACLADEAACAAPMADSIEMACQAEHMMDECTEDADCVLNMTCNTTTGYCAM